MTIIGFVRHGVTDWNLQRRAQGQTDIPLNDEGKAQAQRLAARLVREEWDLVVSSDLSRAFDTAKVVAEKLDIPLYQDTRLREISFGKLEGLTKEARDEKWGPNWRGLDLGIEPHTSVQERSYACVKEYSSRFPDQNVLFVSHGATLNQIIKILLKNDSFDQGFGNTAVSTFIVEENDNWSCTLLNCTKHLTEEIAK
ncbi:histidine phosphatase family protein [Aquibacillus koreensis]|uniref:Histidine phosphatase family protein n=1 Tax=Aquibacillus koreensis TaxID=279446 RepID=A0A9X3WJ89_9BACI|nr:histidine phosphatase family protein [Aquibacillus koreensis]MCT2534245.1 histidine phosphatase family protein [Aquibacillus koreensis]MDC3420710.1 histidine phosphatase family protein [Aquibacillus koreensis]